MLRLLALSIGLLLANLEIASPKDSQIPYIVNWRRLVEGPSCSPVAVRDSLLYLGSTDCYFYCLRVRDGTVRWRYRTGRANFLLALTARTVLIGSDDGYLYALNRSSGKPQWQVPIRGISTQAIVSKGKVFFGTAEGCLYALKLRQGEVAWRIKVRGRVTTTPAVNNNRVYWGTDSGLYAATINDGFVKWDFPTKAAVSTIPVVRNKKVLWGTEAGYFYALDAQNGSLLWKRRVGGGIRSPAVRKGKVFFGSTNGWIYSLNLTEGKVCWRQSLGVPVSSGVCLTARDVLFVGDDEGELHALDANTGKQLWSFPTSGSLQARPVVSNQTLYFRSGDGYLYSLRLQPAPAKKENHLLWEDWGEQFDRGRKTGYFHEKALKIDQGIKLWTRQVTWEGGFSQTISERIITPQGRLLSFKERRKEGNQVLRVEGKVKGDSLVVEKRLAGGVLREAFFIGKDAVAPEFVEQLLLNRKGLSVGSCYSVPSFDYDSLCRCTIFLTVMRADTLQWQGKPLPVRVLRRTSDLPEMKGIEVWEWVTAQGRILKVECPSLGISSLVTSQKQALRWEEPKEEDTIPVDVSIKSPLQVDSLDVRVIAPPVLLGRIPSCEERQKVHILSDSTLEIQIKKVAVEGENALTLPISAPRLKAFLRPTLFIQSDNPRIVKKAKEIVGEERNSWRASKRLLQWVYSHMTPKQTNVRFKSALEVLNTMEGTCSEYTVLFVALARAAGIPARVCGGLMALGKDHFGLHMWAQVYTGDWIDVDPSWNQMPVDATHIELASTSLALEELPKLNIPVALTLVHLDTIRVVSYRCNGQLELTAAEQLFEKASSLRAEFKNDSALEILNQLYITLPPNNRTDDALYEIGEIMLDKRKFKEAKSKFRKLLKMFPHSELADNALFQLGKIYQQQGQPDSTLVCFQRLVKRFPGSELADDALYKTGELYEKVFSNFETAEEIYKRVIAEYGESGWAPCAREALKRCTQEKGQAPKKK